MKMVSQTRGGGGKPVAVVNISTDVFDQYKTTEENTQAKAVRLMQYHTLNTFEFLMVQKSYLTYRRTKAGGIFPFIKHLCWFF